MNIANKLTLLRVILVPFFAFFMLAGDIVPYSYLWAAVIFAVASITDTADGKIARKYNMVTNFGKFLDPLADKVLVVTALICFVELGWASAWVTAIIVAREFVVSGIRLIAAGSEKKTVIAASIWGKLKTASTMVAKLSSVRVISAAPFATSVPVIPIAQPISAAFNAGASFTPSPVMETT